MSPGGSTVSDETKGTEKVTEGEGKETEAYLGSWKTKEDAAEGLKNLQAKLSEQGAEAGDLRKQMEDGQSLMQEMQEKLNVAEQSNRQKASDDQAAGLVSEQDKINKQISDLDPVDEGYSQKLMKLIGKSNALTAQQQHEQTLGAATQAFRKELDERDVQSAHRAFNEQNPEFSTPEMQAKIKEYIAKDKTGMSDALVAFREIQRDDAAMQLQEISKQNAELMERLNLKKGTDETGNVIIKSQGTQESKPQIKLKGADRNKGMMDILNGMKG